MLRDDQFLESIRQYDEANTSSLEIYHYLLEVFNEATNDYGKYGNVIGLFFHDLMVHFTGILIQRETTKYNVTNLPFPFVSKAYALEPFTIRDNNFAQLSKSSLSHTLRRVPVMSVAAGEAIPFGHRRFPIARKIFSFVTSYQAFERAYLPRYSCQLALLETLIVELCRRYQIPKQKVILDNWKRYAAYHTMSDEPVIRNKSLIVGTRTITQNRKLAINYLQQDRPVIGFTHGEITNTIFDEPVFSYAELGMCSSLVDYGCRQSKRIASKPLVGPDAVLSRTSVTIRSLYRWNDAISGPELYNSRILYIPTMYDGGYCYGPYRAFGADEVYEKWQSYLVSAVRGVTIKVHPKSRMPRFDAKIDSRRLEDAISEYDVLILDYYSTAASIAMFTDKPVIYFDIGLRNMTPKFLNLIRKRCHYRTIDWSSDVYEQISDQLRSFHDRQGEWSNDGLEDYSIMKDGVDGLSPLAVLAKTH